MWSAHCQPCSPWCPLLGTCVPLRSQPPGILLARGAAQTPFRQSSTSISASRRHAAHVHHAGRLLHMRTSSLAVGAAPHFPGLSIPLGLKKIHCCNPDTCRVCRTPDAEGPALSTWLEPSERGLPQPTHLHVAQVPHAGRLPHGGGHAPALLPRLCVEGGPHRGSSCQPAAGCRRGLLADTPYVDGGVSLDALQGHEAVPLAVLSADWLKVRVNLLHLQAMME